jgi:hypothetical protein
MLMPDLDTDDLAALVTACNTDLGDPNLWFTPDGYPDSLALCIIDSIHSTGARYSSVVNVVGRYREYRTNQRGDPDTDGTDELANTISELGGADASASRIGNRRPTSTAAGWASKPWAASSNSMRNRISRPPHPANTGTYCHHSPGAAQRLD